MGVKEALRKLNSIDKVARRQLTKDYAQIVSPIVTEARGNTPVQPPLSGMAYQWKGRGARATKPVFPWAGAKDDRSIRSFVSGKRPRQYGNFVSNLATFGIKWTSPSALAVEMSGKGAVPTVKGKQMVDSLTRRYGEPGRFLWRAYLRHESAVIRDVQKLINDLMRRIERDI